MNGNLVNEETGKTSMLSQKVKLYIPEVANYEIKYHKDGYTKDYIVACDETDNPIPPKMIVPTYTDSREVLDSLLDMNFKIVNNMSYSRERQYKEIIKWCQKYGYPTSRKFDEDFDEEVNNYFYSFNCELFLNELAKIYTMFIWILACRPDLYIGLENGKVNRERIHEKYIYNMMKKHDVLEIQNSLLNHFKEIRFKMDIEFIDGKYTLVPTFNDLFELAKYQLLLLYNADNTTGIKECKCCGKLFSCVHRSQKYCDDCSPQKNYARKVREKKKKEGADNGNYK